MKEAEVRDVAESMAKNKPSTIVWAMGQTQHTNGNAIVRASCILQLALGNVGVVGRRHEHLPRPRQRAGRDRYRPEPRFAARLLRRRDGLVEALRGGLGRRLRMAEGAVRHPDDDGKTGHHGLALDRRGAREKRAHRSGLEPARRRLLGPCAEQPEPRQGNAGGDEEARSSRRRRSVSVGDCGDGGARAQGRRVSAARRDAARVRRLGHGVEPLAAVARARDRAAVRVAHRSHDHVSARAEVRLRQAVRRQDQAAERQRRHGRAVDGRHAARNQPRHVDHRLYRPVARAAAGAHAQHARVRREDAARQRRQGREDRLRARRRLLRPAVAVLRHAGAEASGLAESLSDLAARDGRRRQLPRELRRRARRREPARRGRLAFGRAPTSRPAIPSSITCS